MPFNNPSFPMQFLVGRELAKRQKVDDATATRLALTGSLLGGGLLGPILARQLAIREAPAVPATTSAQGKPLPPPGKTVTQQFERIGAQFQALIEADKKAEADAEAQAEALLSHARALRQERAKVLRELCVSLNGLSDTSPSGFAAQGSEAAIGRD